VLKKPDIKQGEKIISDLLEWLKIPITNSTRNTPKRVAKMYVNELCSGMYTSSPKITKFDSDIGMVCVTDITFTSMCEHHLLPIIGKCSIVYLANNKVIGLSKLARIVRHISARPGLQEIITNQIAEEVMRLLKPRGVYVAVSAEHLCYDKETEILSEKGFVLFKNLSKNIKVAQYNKDTKKISFVIPKAYIKKRYNNFMYHFKNLSYDKMVTKDHRVLYRTDWDKRNNRAYKVNTAKNINNRRIFLPIVGYYGGIKGKNVLLNKKISFYDYCSFMGMYLSNGCISYTPKDKKWIIKIKQDYTSKGYNDFKSLLDKLPFNYHSNDYYDRIYKKRRQAFVIYSKELYEHLKQFGKVHNKFVPDNIKYGDKKGRELFIKYFWLGDGYKIKANIYFTITGIRLGNDIQELLFLNGKATSLNIRKKGTNNVRDIIVHVDKSGKDKIEELVKSPSKILYNDFVYSVEVDDTFIVTRRNGRIAISGNCMTIRGVKAIGSRTNTASYLGDININEAIQLLEVNKFLK